MGANPNDMMSLLDSSLFTGFDGMPMTLDVGDSMPPPPMPHPLQHQHQHQHQHQQQHQPYGSAGIAHAPPPALAPTAMNPDDQDLYSADDLIVAASDTGSQISPGTMNSAANNPAANPTANTNANAQLTEFTKRRNWPARVVEELKDWLHILDSNGKIKHVSPSVERLTGYKPQEILNRFLVDFIHPDDTGVFQADFNDAISHATPLRMFYRFKKKDSTYVVFETVGHAHIASMKFAPTTTPSNQTAFCQAVFMMARPYPTKGAGLLDSFLEHKIENERLQRRIKELEEEEKEENRDSQSAWRQSQEGRSDMTPSEGTTPFYQPSGNQSIHSDLSMPPPASPTSTNSALTRENLEGIAGGRPDSIREKMARYEGAIHSQTIEMLTGLREGERRGGMVTGSGSSIIKGDAGIAIPMDRDPRTGEKKKKLKVAEEYVCTDCGEYLFKSNQS
jgi:PAS domain S-box-containing protein